MLKWAKLLNRDNVEKIVSSPNGRNKAFFILKKGELFYKIERDEKPLIGLSKLGFKICGEEPLEKNFGVTKKWKCSGARIAISKICIMKRLFIFRKT